jgi:ABC-type dipeptide/oligopeptide/nickel transport system permease subunit
VISAILTVLIFYSVDLITLASDPRMKKNSNTTASGQLRARRAGSHRNSDEQWDSLALIPVPLGPNRRTGRAALLARSLAESATAAKRLARMPLISDWRTELAACWTAARRWAGVILPTLFIIGLVLAAFFAPLRYNPDAVSPYATFQPPSLLHWFGTDSIGRDVFSRTIVSARTDIPLALAGATLSLALGVPLGLLASLGGRLSVLIMRGLDVFQALPLVVLAITLVVLTGNHLVNVIPAILVFGVPQFIRITRASAQSIAGRRFVDAARASGASNLAILWHEILPNIRGTVLGQ